MSTQAAESSRSHHDTLESARIQRMSRQTVDPSIVLQSTSGCVYRGSLDLAQAAEVRQTNE